MFTEREVFTIPDALWTYQTGPELTVGMSGGDTTALGDLDNDGDLDLIAGVFGPVGGHPSVFYPLLVNDGAGNFTEQAATRFNVGAFTGKLYATDVKLADLDADGDLDLAAYAQNGLADIQGNNLQVFLNDGSGNLTFTTGKTPAFTPPAGGINAFDVTDYTGDGAIDLWVGNQGGRVLTFVNTYADPMGVPADVPRGVRIVSATTAGVRLAWLPPRSASPVRFYRVYRSSTPGLPVRDRVLVKTVALSEHADDGFVAPITRRTTATQLADAAVTIDATTGELQWIDATAVPGVTYQYSVTHVGNETKASTPSAEVAAMVPAPSGTDSTGPQLTIVSPTIQQWAAYPRIVLQYADAQSAVDPASVRVSFSAALGSRAAGSDISDLANYKDARVFAAPLAPPYSLPLNTLVTMTATVSDTAGNSTTQAVQFFVTTASAQLPVAAFTATPEFGAAPVDVAFDATASTDAGGKVVQYEWYFGDGTMGTGATAAHRYTTGGSFVATLVVRDTQGGVATATRTITTQGAPPECANGEVRSCYSGPMDTEAVGACAAGAQTCETGLWQAECPFQVVPTDEVCDDGVDNDCDGTGDAEDTDCGGAGDDAASGCGCGTSHPAAGLVTLLVVIALGSRRRRRISA